MTFSYLLRLCLLLSLGLPAWLQAQPVPKVLGQIKKDGPQTVVTYNDQSYQEVIYPARYTLTPMYGNPKGSEKGILLDFGDPELAGEVFYGFIPYGDSRHPMPVYFKRTARILGGKTFINIGDQMGGRYDMIGWEETGRGTLGYRVVNAKGAILYDGRVGFKGTGPFEIDDYFIEGPGVNLLTHRGAVISFQTNNKLKGRVEINGGFFEDDKKTTHHEIAVDGLMPGKTYPYTVYVGENQQTYELTTAPAPGSRTAFSFAYASDSRNGQGGGERNIYGTNAYIMKKIMALATHRKAAFMQFSGDMINGYLTDPEEMHLQYANWKRAIEPFTHYLPVYPSMGNHEALMRVFSKEGSSLTFSLDRWPYDEVSSEVVFAENFVLPTNGPESEDGAAYDPNARKMDFPPYRENVFYYAYDNVAVIVLNSDYWYTPSSGMIPVVGGGLHGYIMDQQLAWLEETLKTLEADANVDHIFLTQHTPCFPNGGHVGDDMWYGGNNDPRPFVDGKPLAKGIIERRDQYLDLIINQSEKVVAILTGDEHNYARTEVGPETPRYPEDFPESNRVTLDRTIWQINNGAAGAPYYAQEQTPWSSFVQGFTTQNALVFFHVNGKEIIMEVRNPDTLEEVDRMKLR